VIASPFLPALFDRVLLLRGKQSVNLLLRLLEAVPNFASLFRHVLIAMGEEPESGPRAMLQTAKEPECGYPRFC